MNLGGVSPINKEYLKSIRKLKETFQASLLSDHLCWSAYGKYQHHDLLPLPYSKESISHLANRIREVQDFMGEKIAVENLSSYIEFQDSKMPEWEFVSQVVEKANCYLLLDINNAWINSQNFGYSIEKYLENIPTDRISHIHLSGGEQQDSIILDTHGSSVWKEVWTSYKSFIQKTGPKATMIERDKNIPPFSQLLEEHHFLKDILYGPF